MTSPVRAVSVFADASDGQVSSSKGASSLVHKALAHTATQPEKIAFQTQVIFDKLKGYLASVQFSGTVSSLGYGGNCAVVTVGTEEHAHNLKNIMHGVLPNAHIECWLDTSVVIWDTHKFNAVIQAIKS